MDCGSSTSSVAAAQADSFRLQVQMAVAKKQLNATKLQGEAIVELLQQAAGAPRSDRATQLDFQA